MSETGEESPLAMVDGQPFLVLPDDLYIPPDALEIFLEAFEGPLDLLLYLIKKQNVDILNIPILEITRQYMDYIALIENCRIELAAEYLLMAAILAEIKSRLLLPRQVNEEEEEADPRAELVRRLQEYERYKLAAFALDELPRQERDIFIVKVMPPDLKLERPLPDVSFAELMEAFSQLMKRAKMHEHHHIQRETFSVREKMMYILEQLKENTFSAFEQFIEIEQGRMGVVVTFIAILELVKQSMIQLVQSSPFSPIHITTVGSECTITEN